jgi:lysozyme family protein
LLSITQDGIIGPVTISKIDKFDKNILEYYASKRKGYYSSLAANNPKLKVFLNGWYNRVDSTNFI